MLDPNETNGYQIMGLRPIGSDGPQKEKDAPKRCPFINQVPSLEGKIDWAKIWRIFIMDKAVSFAASFSTSSNH